MTGRIEVRGVTQRYGDVTALDDVSFTLEGGKIHGLLGRNGSGKTSLLSVMAAFRKPTAGEVLLDGEPIYEQAAQMQQIAFIRESGDTVEDSEKASEALRMAAYLRPNWDADYAERLMERFRVPTKTAIGKMSRGQRSALGIVLGLASRAPVTIFDETYLGLDAPSRAAFYDALLADYMETGRTFIVSTHLIEEVSSLLETVLILHHGTLLVHEETSELLTRGAAITGPAEVVARVTADLRVIERRQLGRTVSAMVFGELDAAHVRAARAEGLEVEPIALQELFIQLTGDEGGVR